MRRLIFKLSFIYPMFPVLKSSPSTLNLIKESIHKYIENLRSQKFSFSATNSGFLISISLNPL